MNRRPVIIAAFSCAVVFIISLYWWRTTSDDGNLRSLSSLLAPLKCPDPVVPADIVANTDPATNTDMVAVTNNFEVIDKVAVIIESRPMRSLIPLILHFASVLGPEWPIYFFTRAPTLRTLEAFGGGSKPFQRVVKSGQVKIIELPATPLLVNYLGISNFLGTEWFWTQLLPAKHMLLFQTDSIICANSAKRMEDFIEWDFIGAAHPFVPDAFNGGLSLRSVPVSLEVVRTHDIAFDVANGTKDGWFEDVWFSRKMRAMGAHLPSREIAHQFVVDFEWFERPLGYHGVNKGAHDDHMEEIYGFCPEAILAQDQVVVNLTKTERENFIDIPANNETEGGATLQFLETR